MDSNIKRHISNGVLIGVFTAFVIVIISELLIKEYILSLEAKTYDWRFQTKIEKFLQRNDSEIIEDIIIVDIDNRSLEKLGNINKWSRKYHAKIIDYLTGAGAMAIGFDILFNESDEDSLADQALIEATKKALNVCHAVSFSRAEPDAFLYEMETPPQDLEFDKYSFSFSDTVSRYLHDADRFDGKLFDLYNSAGRLGYANFQPDGDNVIRKMPLFMNFAGRQYPSFALAIILMLWDIKEDQIEIDAGNSIQLHINDTKSINIPIDDQCRMIINYKGTFQTFRYVSYYDVYAGRIPPEFFKDRVVLVGASAAGLYDVRSIPFQSTFPGVEIHANIICNILTDDFIHKSSNLFSILFLLAFITLVALVSSAFRLYISIPFIIISSVFYVYFSYSFFEQHRLWIEIVRPVVSVFLCYLCVLIYRYNTELKEKMKIRNMFQHYISASVVDRILKKPELLKLGGEKVEATAFFSDIKNFTTISEKLHPEELVALLNEYFSGMTDVIFKYNGYLDKYQGDAIVSMFGVPIEVKDHALQACNAAIDMNKELKKLHEQWKDMNRPLFEIRIGINTGLMIAGNIGGKDRFDYTAIGDSVNLAARLESANKMYGTNIIISENTFKLVNDQLWVRELDLIRVKGKLNPVRIYEVLGRKSEKIDPVRSSSLEYFVQGLEFYHQREWVNAFDYFQKALQLVPNDGPSIEFIRRCKIFIENPRSEDWDGVFNLLSK